MHLAGVELRHCIVIPSCVFSLMGHRVKASVTDLGLSREQGYRLESCGGGGDVARRVQVSFLVLSAGGVQEVCELEGTGVQVSFLVLSEGGVRVGSYRAGSGSLLSVRCAAQPSKNAQRPDLRK